MGADPDPGTPRTILLLAAARTGSNHLLTLLDAVPELRVRFEVFHPLELYGFDDRDTALLAAAAGIAGTPDKRDERLIRWARENRKRIPDILHAAREGCEKHIVFKVFPGQLTAGEIADAFLGRPDICVLMLRRRAVDSFVSIAKAHRVATFTGVDTTEVRPAVRAWAFARYWRNHARWYRNVSAVLRGRGLRFADMTYETDVDGDPARALNIVLGHLRDAGVGVSAPDAVPAGLRRQDKATDWRRKIANPRRFRLGCALRGIGGNLERHFPIED